MNVKIFGIFSLLAVVALMGAGCRRQPAPPDEKKNIEIQYIADPTDTMWIQTDSFPIDEKNKIIISTRGFYVDGSDIVYFQQSENGLTGYQHPETGIEVKWDGPEAGSKKIDRRMFKDEFDSSYLAHSMLISPKILGYNILAQTIPLKITMLKLENGVHYNIFYTVNLRGDDTFEIVD